VERERLAALREFEHGLGHRFASLALLDRALTHSSHAHEVHGAKHNEALEFLGDAVLGFLVAELLHRNDPDGPEGFKTRARNRLVSTSHLKHLARELGIPALLAVGRSERKGKASATKARMWVNAYEAVLAAVYLDGGLEAARELVEHQFARELEHLDDIAANDHKTALQEWLQARGEALPRYEVVAEASGVDGAGFEVRCDTASGVSARGSGRTKKQAQQEAARRVLGQLESAVEQEAVARIERGEGT
jgi:ribonuclease-3